MIQVFTTGGTIDKAYFDSLSKYQVGDSQVARLLQTARVMQPFDVEELLRKDSLDFREGDRLLIRDAVAGAPAKRIIITHGTDTITETANILTSIGDKSVVLVGALAPARFVESDAAFNLGMAFATVQIAGPGVFITMNGTVFHAGRVRKDRDSGCFVTA